MNQSTTDNRFMEFRLGNQLYALPLLTVKEVIPKPDISAMPNSVAHFEGMINLRGQILGVFNLRKRLNSKAADKTASEELNVVIVIEQNGVCVGMMVDEVTRVIHASADKISNAPLKDDDPAKSFVSSVIRVEEELVLVVQVTNLLELNKFKSNSLAA